MAPGFLGRRETRNYLLPAGKQTLILADYPTSALGTNIAACFAASVNQTAPLTAAPAVVRTISGFSLVLRAIAPEQ